MFGQHCTNTRATGMRKCSSHVMTVIIIIIIVVIVIRTITTIATLIY